MQTAKWNIQATSLIPRSFEQPGNETVAKHPIIIGNGG